MSSVRVLAGSLTICLLISLQPPSTARAFIGDNLACAFDETSTGCIARRISALFQAAPAGGLKDRSAAILSYSWARRGQKLFSLSMERASKDQRYRAYAAVMARSAQGDFKTARRAAPYIKSRGLWLRAMWIYAMAGIRLGKPAEAKRVLPALLRQQAKVKSPISRMRARCRIAMVQARVDDLAAAKASVAAVRKTLAEELPPGRAHRPLLIACAAAISSLDGRPAAEKMLSETVSRLRADAAMPPFLRLVFLAQVAEQWTYLGAYARSRALGLSVLNKITPLSPNQRLRILEYLLFASFRPAAK